MTQGRVIRGRGASPGVAEGAALVSDSTLTGWDTFDLVSGTVNEVGHPLHGQSVKGKVLIIRGARGSTGWGTQFLKLRVAGLEPAAMIFPAIDSRIGTACVVTRVPVVTDLDEDIFALCRSGDRVRVDGDKGVITILGTPSSHRPSHESELY